MLKVNYKLVPAKKIFLGMAFLLLILGCADSYQQPNVVLIIADDVSADFSCFDGQIQTPNIDRLAQQGVRFENAYVTASSCSPSRCSIITGRYPHNTGAPELHMDLPEGQFQFPLALKDAGYYTAQAGKWHMGDAPRPAFDKIYDDPYPVDPTGSKQWVKSLQERPKEQPFFMWFASYDAHRPWEPDTVEKAHDPAMINLPAGVPDTPKSRQDIASYYDEIRRFDRYVGFVIAELKHQGVFDNTLIILLGDNGRPFPRSKTTLYDNGMKTPLIVHWPKGKFEDGALSTSLVSSIDIAPAILEAAGIEIPPQVQGVSLLPMCRQPEVQTREVVYGERNWHVQRACGRMIRKGDLVYIRDFTPNNYSFQMVDHEKGAYAELLRLKKEGKLSPIEAETFSIQRDEEMLFNVLIDSQQVVNLVSNPEYEKELDYFRNTLSTWQERSGDSLPALEEMTPDRHDPVSFKRLYKERRPSGGIVPGEKANATLINYR
jgi:arylsulfatase A-like enzyme